MVYATIKVRVSRSSGS